MPKMIEGILNAWKGRSLSLIGKVLVINALVASLFVYKMTVLPTIPDRIVCEIEKLLNQFIWKENRPKIQIQSLQNAKVKGLN